MQFILSLFNIRVWSLLHSVCVLCMGTGWVLMAAERSEVGTNAFFIKAAVWCNESNRIGGAATCPGDCVKGKWEGELWCPGKDFFFLNPCLKFTKSTELTWAALGFSSSWCVSLSERCKVSGMRISLAEHLHLFRRNCMSNWTLSQRTVNMIRLPVGILPWHVWDGYGSNCFPLPSLQKDQI